MKITAKRGQDGRLRTREVLGLKEEKGLGPVRLTGVEKAELVRFIEKFTDNWLGQKSESLWYFLELAGGSDVSPELVQKILSDCKKTIYDLRDGVSVRDESRSDYDWRPYFLARALIQRFQPELAQADPNFHVDDLVRKEVARLLNRDITSSDLRGEADWHGLLLDSFFILATLPELADLVIQKLLHEKFWGNAIILDKAHEEVGQNSNEEILLHPSVVKLLCFMGQESLPVQLSPAESQAMKAVHLRAQMHGDGEDYMISLRRLYFIQILRSNRLTRGSNGLISFDWSQPISPAVPLPARDLVTG